MKKSFIYRICTVAIFSGRKVSDVNIIMQNKLLPLAEEGHKSA